MTVFELLIVLSAAGTTAIVSTYLMNRQRRAVDRDKPEVDTSTRFLFEGETLVNATEAAEQMIDHRDYVNSDWRQLANRLQPRFPGFPTLAPGDPSLLPLTLDSTDLGPLSQVAIEPARGLVRVKLIETYSLPRENVAQRHDRRIWNAQVDTLREAVEHCPYPVWKSEYSGRIVWANAAYKALASACFGPEVDRLPVLFDLPDKLHNSPKQMRRRVKLTLRDSGEAVWYDVSTVRTQQTTMYYAVDINAVVQAETAQRDFVSTMAQTFAQLSIGLAIFDRNRTLKMFNPALRDLTDLPIDFLSNRPHLHDFFDRLRDAQVMPEPKNYNNWRAVLDQLTAEADEGSYLDTWTLASGQTYQISGRPHPDGAIAFLIEDISAEVSLTRSFRADLQLNQSVLNSLDKAIAVFSADGRMNFSNASYRQMWATHDRNVENETDLYLAMEHWRAGTLPNDIWSDLERLSVSKNGAESIKQELTTPSGQRIIVGAKKIGVGSIVVTFEPSANIGHTPELSGAL